MSLCGIRRRRRSACVLWVIFVACIPSVLATTVIPPTFEELVGRAEIAFESEVISTQARITAERDGHPIVTTVTFRVVRALKGKPGTTVLLDFLGGTVDDQTYRVDGTPTFRVGDRDVVFAVTSQRLISPLVGMAHGRIRIVTDPATRQSLVRRYNGQPLRELSSLGSAETAAPLSQTPAMSLGAFENAVVAEVARQARLQ